MQCKAEAPWHNKRVKTPTVLQREWTESGAACLAMILAYFGKIVPLAELREECGVSRDGAKPHHIAGAARRYGLGVEMSNKEPYDLRALSLPMIVYWNSRQFVVLEGIRKGKVYVNDPGSGRRVVGEDVLNQAFSGVVLTFAPGPDFRKGGPKPGYIRAFRRGLAGAGSAVAFVGLCGLFLVIPGLILPTFLQVYLDNILIKGMTDWIRPLLLTMGLTALVRAMLTWMQEVTLTRLDTKMALISSATFFRHVFRLPVGFFAQRYGGEICGRVQTNDKMAFLLSRGLAGNVLSILQVLFFSALMFQYDFLLTLLGILGVLAGVWTMNVVGGKQAALRKKLLREQSTLNGMTMTGLQTIETLKATGSESDFFSQWAGCQAKVLNAQQDLMLAGQYLSQVPLLVSTLTNIMVLSIGGLRVMNGYLSIGMLIAFQTLMSSLSAPIKTLIDQGGNLQQAESDLDLLDDVLQVPLDPRFRNENAALEEAEKNERRRVKLAGYVELRSITFGYSKLDPPLIEEFSLTLKPGDRVALVGSSGSGKSTIAKLIAGLYEPWSGEVLLDRKPRNTYSPKLINNSIAVVDQDIFLFQGTVKENITMWDNTLTDMRIVRAAHDACIHDEIAARVGGYDSGVAEGGSNFSGGQRQRLEIARALVNDPSIVILDEATSALDTVSEKIVDDNLRRRGCTCIIIAHRLSTIRDCDEIVVMQGGRVVQRGTHEQMLKVDGPYADLVGSQ